MKLLFGDLETFSPIEIKCGANRYSDEAEILLFPYAIDDGEVKCWDVTSGEPMPEDLAAALQDQTVLTVWQNGGMFDSVVMNKVRPGGFGLPTERIFDTMVCAYAHALPGSLEILCSVLGIDEDKVKHKAGKKLIQLFCKPRPKNMKLRRATRDTHPEEWQQFIEYAKADITSMREVYFKLPRWNYQAPHGQDPAKYEASTAGREYRLWLLDQKINQRGVAVDRTLAASAVDAAIRARDRLAARAHEITDGSVASTTQRNVLLEHIFEQYGIPLDDLQADTIERRLSDPDIPEALKELLGVRLQATSTSVKKYETLIKATNEDGRLRGLLQFNGAARTGRWSGRIFQPQNLPRPNMKQKAIDFAIEAVKSGSSDLLYDNVMEVLTNCIRGCLVAPEGRKLVVADLSNIEGRMAAYLAGEDWKIKYFHDYDAGLIEHDNYVMAYAKSFAVDPAMVQENKKHGDGTMRQIGKVQELMLQYQGRVGAFVTGAATYRIDLEDLAKAVKANVPAEVWEKSKGFMEWSTKQGMSTYGLSEDAFVACDCLTMLWREAHPAISSFWGELQQGFIDAVGNPGTTFTVRTLKFRKDGAWLRVRLPSGRSLCYPSARVEDDGSLSYLGIDQYTRKWQRLSTYGGKLLENCIAEGTPVLTRRGWVAIERVGDEEVWDGEEWVRHEGLLYRGNQTTIEQFCVRMTPDHMVLTEGGWRSASSCEGHNRFESRIPDGYEIRGVERGEVPVGSEVRMRSHRSVTCNGVEEATQQGDHRVVRVHARDHHAAEENHPRYVNAPSLRRMEEHARQVQATITPGVAQLRRAWDNCVREVGVFLREFLVGHGGYIPQRVCTGAAGQFAGVLPRELRMEDNARASEQQKEQQDIEHATREDDRKRSSGLLQGEVHDAVVPPRRGVATGESVERVYDLKNCGPRNSFVVMGHDNQPLIVHNCTQAASRDVMAHAMPLAEADGFDITLTVHDELITETPDEEEYNADRLGAWMAQVPEWAPGLPLAAAGFEAYRYRKD